MRITHLALPLCLTIVACGPAAEAPAKPAKIAISDATIRLPAADGRPAAGYFTLRGGSAPDRLVSISSTKAATIELHESRMSGGMMTMRALTGVDLPAHGTVAFVPGGNHAMLFGLDPAVKPGAKIKLRFTFQNAGTVETEAATISAGDALPAATASEHDGH